MKINFTWDVCTDGYEWKAEGPDSGFGPEWYLQPRGWQFRRYRPLKEFGALFRDFADLELTDDAFRTFADRYGNLGADEWEQFDPGGDPIEVPEDCTTEVEKARFRRGLKREFRRADRWDTWVNSIRELRACVRRWDEVQGGSGGRREMEGVKDTIDLQLEKEELRVAFAEDETTGAFSLQVEPRSLLGALWAQFAVAVGEAKKFRQCRTCGRWFELSPEAARTNRRFCSEACRSKAYRGRKERARELAAQGRTPDDIARELDSDLETVRSWLTTTPEVHHGAQTKGARRGRRLPAAERRQAGRLDHHGEDPLGLPEAKGRLRRDQGGGTGETQ
jgi:hypothetical protein